MMMKSLHRHLLAAGLLAGLGLAAIAQTQTPAPATAGAAPAQQLHAHRGDPAKFAERQARRQELRQVRLERRLAALKLKLQISAAQEGAWNTWTAAMKPPAQRQRLDRAEIVKMSTPERIDRMRVLRTARIAEIDRRGEATKAFYGVLGADQKKVFDGESLRFGKRGHKGHRGHRGHAGDHHRLRG